MTRISLYEPFASVFPPELFASAINASAWPEWSRSSATPVAQNTRVTAGGASLGMPVDVLETASGWTIRAELAGVTKDQIDIQIDANTVSISAKRERKSEPKDGERLLRAEISAASVMRSFVMPSELDESAASASFDAGILTLQLPRKKAQLARKLAVQ
ncbi:MAG: Hsp20/alpha crystallin family protein [Betaproteobacteria bacterium]|nr:Hsp20/alpha crystallin family protein [Pseudomonadota bacterium]NBO45177.1 Hsp20/alpha crystallin family protein [Betaproteobacteria bacterium]NBP10602.1 Hsp20/alpha crystallin family protein [Betaproteobacteria bacterium]NBP62468.1 Hsp20/alpha crystallin family protein [Betaproteobacteria bacterium]NBQ09500.1 Hsp20/alpha crystallin family protein [Betaproteobacteria bacterium]